MLTFTKLSKINVDDSTKLETNDVPCIIVIDSYGSPRCRGPVGHHERVWRRSCRRMPKQRR